MKKALNFLLILVTGFTFAQQDVYIHFTPKISGTTVNNSDLGTTVFQDLSNIAFQVEAFNYYISKLEIVHDGGQTINFDTADDVLLVKVQNTSFNLGQYTITNVEQVNFGVGVHQDFNHLDPSTYSSGHPLGFQMDPVMQWGWTAGYKHMALDGLGDNNNDDTPTELFQPHCLGDGNYKNVQLPITSYVDSQNQMHIYVNCNLEEWIFGTNPGTTGVQHTSTGIAITVMNNVNNRNVFEASSFVSLEEKEEVGVAYFHNLENGVKISWEEMNNLSHYQLIDMSGQSINKGKNNNPSGQVIVRNLESGTFIVNFFDENNRIIHSMKLIH